MQMCGREVRIEIAFPRPMVEPPPMEMTQSADLEAAKERASEVMSVGVCIAALVKVPQGVMEAEVRMAERTEAWSTCWGWRGGAGGRG